MGVEDDVVLDAGGGDVGGSAAANLDAVGLAAAELSAVERADNELPSVELAAVVESDEHEVDAGMDGRHSLRNCHQRYFPAGHAPRVD